MHEKHPRVRRELTAVFDCRLERALMSAEPVRPNGRKNLLASEPRYRPRKNPAITPKTIRTMDVSR
jgi:hypothetical protein